MLLHQGALYTRTIIGFIFFSFPLLKAMARVWRDGQKKTVHIYRLLTAGQKTQPSTGPGPGFSNLYNQTFLRILLKIIIDQI